MKQKRLSAAIAVVLACSPLIASAEVVLTASGTGTTASSWAKELNKDDSAIWLHGVDGVNTSALNIQVEVGFGFPVSTTRFLRLDLGQGAKFHDAPDCSVAAVGATCSARTGGAGFSYATFNLTSDSSTPVASIEPVFFTFPTGIGAGVRVVSNDTTTIRYSLHNNDVSVDATNQASATAILNEKVGDYIKFDPVLNVEASSTATLVADVSAGFLQFTSGDTGAIGVFDYSSSNSLLTVDSTLEQNKTATVADVISAATLTVTGDFTAAQDFTGTNGLGTYTTAPNRVFLHKPSGAELPCDTVTTPAASVSATEAVFNLGTTSTGLGTYICIKANGVTPISPSIYNMAIDFTTLDGYTADDFTADNIGEIRQNGTVLDTPYLTRTAGYISRVMLTNTGTKDAPYTATVVTDDGGTATTGTAETGVIPAGANIQINASDLVTFSGKPRGAVRFVITAPNQTIQGIYQTVNLATFDAQSVVMIRRGGGDGQ